MVATAGFDPERQFVAEIVAIVEEAAALDQKPPRVVAGSAIEPADRRLPCELFDALDAEANMLALGLFIDFEIVEPTVAVADDLVSLCDEGRGQLRTLLQGADHAEDADLDAEARENPQQAAATTARPVFEHRLYDGAANAGIARQADIVQRVLGALVAFEQTMLAPGFDVEIDVDGDARAAGPFRIGRMATVAAEIARQAPIAGRSGDRRIAHARCSPMPVALKGRYSTL